MLKISILVDNSNSWIVPFAQKLEQELAKTYDVKLYFNAGDLLQGDMLFLLGCISIVPPEVLKRFKNNLVIHESDLPKGRGWSPLSWQVLENKNRIPITLFEAVEEPDAGPVYLKDHIELDGTELLPEIKQKQGKKTIELVYRFLEKWTDIKGEFQKGEPSYYRRRTRQDDKIAPEKSIIENFNHLRIVDNEKFPAWFEYKGHRYILKIYKQEKKENR
ncbi:MAG: methionyl-tRNA formyltransferase [bacterium]|nr:methionyl-tRNA formyltransferase [bacterium]